MLCAHTHTHTHMHTHMHYTHTNTHTHTESHSHSIANMYAVTVSVMHTVANISPQRQSHRH